MVCARDLIGNCDSKMACTNMLFSCPVGYVVNDELADVGGQVQKVGK